MIHIKLNTIEFPIKQCENNIYIQIDGTGKGRNFDLIFKNFKDLNISISGKIFNLLDNFGTKDRKKLTILNYNFLTINVNNHEISLDESIGEKKSNFIQYSLNLEDYKIIAQPREEPEKPDLDLLMKNKKIYNEFYTEIESLFEYELNYKNQYFIILNDYKRKKNIRNFGFYLNLSEEYLEDYFNINNIDLETIYKYKILWLFFEGKRKYSSDKTLFKGTVDKLKDYCDNINKNEKLKIYQKIILLCRISRILFYCFNKQSLDKLDIQYYLINECEKNSIIDVAIRCYDEFTNNITENSKIFQYLLNIDSGIGFYNNELVYTYDMTNLEKIKKHLKVLRPKLLLFYSCENDTLANIQTCFPCVAINRYNFLKKISPKKIIFNKYVKEDEDIINDLAIDMFTLFIHESMGHHKFAYNKRLGYYSPKKIINESNDLIELKRYCDFQVDGKEYILGHKCINKGDSGTYLEYGFGKYGRELITDLLRQVKDKGNLIKRIDLFTDQNCDLLRKYTILKFEAKIRNIDISKKNNIEEEIQELEKLINYGELFKKNIDSKKENSNYLGKKVKKENFKGNNNNSESDDDNSQFEDNEKNKKKKVDNNKITDKDELKEKNESVKDYSNDSDCKDDEDDDDDELFAKLYKRVIEKYGFKNDEMIKERIHNKLKDESLTQEEKFDLNLILHHLEQIW